MFLLFLSGGGLTFQSFNEFTFQYVSIISATVGIGTLVTALFTFQYVSIISMRSEADLLQQSKNLHSNMFLLFLRQQELLKYAQSIYIPICFYYFWNGFKTGLEITWKFTFQYVSIISAIEIAHSAAFFNLHSNMFLLFRVCHSFTSGIDNVIYIPICFYYFRGTQLKIGNDIKHLHSNMFLLFPVWNPKKMELERHLHSNMFLLFPCIFRLHF